MPEASNQGMNNMLAAALFGPQTQAQLLANQQQQALAQALLEQGIQPVSTNNRMMGNIAYPISPFEGLAKMAEVASGKYQQQNANDKLAEILGNATQGMGNGTSLGAMLGRPDLSPMAAMQILNGNRAVAEMVNVPPAVKEAQFGFGDKAKDVIAADLTNKAYPGQSSYQTGLGAAAAGMAPAGTMPQGPPQIDVPQMPVENNYNDSMYTAPTIPVEGPLTDAMTLQQYREQNGMQAPPIDAQRASMGLPAGNIPIPGEKPIDPNSMPQQKPAVPPPGANAFSSTLTGQQGAGGANVPLGSIPQVSASNLRPPSPAGMSNEQYKGALKAWETGAAAQAEVEPARQKAKAVAEATEQGKNIGEANLNLAQINSRIENAKKNITEMLDPSIVDKTSTGVPFLSDETQNDYLQRFDHPTAKANTLLEQKSNQLYVQELAPLIKQLGSRGNMFVERAVKSGSAIDMRDNPESKKAALQGLYEYLDNIQKNTENQQQLVTGQLPLNQAAPGTPIPKPSSVEWIIKDGKLVRQ